MIEFVVDEFVLLLFEFVFADFADVVVFDFLFDVGVDGVAEEEEDLFGVFDEVVVVDDGSPAPPAPVAGFDVISRGSNVNHASMATYSDSVKDPSIFDGTASRVKYHKSNDVEEDDEGFVLFT